MGLVHAGIGSNERDTFFLLFYAFHGGFITIDENDGDIPAIYVILPAYNDDVAARCRYFLFCAKCKLIRVFGLNFC